MGGLPFQLRIVCQPEVDQDGRTKIAVAQEDVVGLDVAVNNFIAVAKLNGIKQVQ